MTLVDFAVTKARYKVKQGHLVISKSRRLVPIVLK